eukprot:8228665-Alexandrium_andersonii.AAC.1
MLDSEASCNPQQSPIHGCAVNPEALHRAPSSEASSAESGGSNWCARWSLTSARPEYGARKTLEALRTESGGTACAPDPEALRAA